MTDEDREAHNPYSDPGRTLTKSRRRRPPPPRSRGRPAPPGRPALGVQPPAVAARGLDAAGDEWAEPKTQWLIETDQDLAASSRRFLWSSSSATAGKAASSPSPDALASVPDPGSPRLRLRRPVHESGLRAARRDGRGGLPGVFTGLFLDWTGNKIKPGDPVAALTILDMTPGSRFDGRAHQSRWHRPTTTTAPPTPDRHRRTSGRPLHQRANRTPTGPDSPSTSLRRSRWP